MNTHAVRHRSRGPVLAAVLGLVGAALLVTSAAVAALPAAPDAVSVLPAPGVAPSLEPLPTPAAAPVPTSRILDVPWYRQAFHASCEAASLRMALAYEGVETTDARILAIIGTDRRAPYRDAAGLHWGDPYTTFVGDPDGSEVALTGYGTYHPTIARAAGSLGGRVRLAGEEIPPATIYSEVLAGHPVVAWVTYRYVAPERHDYVAFDGRSVPYAGPVEHAVAVIGVTPATVVINNPLYGREEVAKATFEASYATYNRMAVVLD